MLSLQSGAHIAVSQVLPTDFEDLYLTSVTVNPGAPEVRVFVPHDPKSDKERSVDHDSP
jgi:hypothetical protein